MIPSEYQHILINAFPVHGTAVAVLMLTMAIALRSRQAQMIALGVLVLLGPVTWAVMKTGDQSMHRIESISNTEGREWLTEHEQRADRGSWVLFLTAAVALAAFISWWRYHASARALSLAALILGFASIGTAGWICRAGGQIRHAEFRSGPPGPGIH